MKRGSRLHRIAVYYPFSSKRHLNTLKRYANAAVKDALATGSLVRGRCAVCSRQKTVEGHHDDYARPLDVIWLCRFHHRKRDALLREQRHDFLKAQRDIEVPKPLAARLAEPRPERKAPLRRSLICVDCTVALVVQATTTVSETMDTERVSESELSRRMKVSRQMVNAQFGAGFRSLKVLAAYADALGYDASFRLTRRAESLEVTA